VSQSKKQSLVESITNIVVGYLISLFAQIIIYPIFDINVELKTNIYISILFTTISLCRSYLLRRFFNSFKKKDNDYTDMKKLKIERLRYL
jgi:hypothetical protein